MTWWVNKFLFQLVSSWLNLYTADLDSFYTNPFYQQIGYFVFLSGVHTIRRYKFSIAIPSTGNSVVHKCEYNQKVTWQVLQSWVLHADSVYSSVLLLLFLARCGSRRILSGWFLKLMKKHHQWIKSHSTKIFEIFKLFSISLSKLDHPSIYRKLSSSLLMSKDRELPRKFFNNTHWWYKCGICNGGMLCIIQGLGCLNLRP